MGGAARILQSSNAKRIFGFQPSGANSWKQIYNVVSEDHYEYVGIDRTAATTARDEALAIAGAIEAEYKAGRGGIGSIHVIIKTVGPNVVP